MASISQKNIDRICQLLSNHLNTEESITLSKTLQDADIIDHMYVSTYIHSLSKNLEGIKNDELESLMEENLKKRFIKYIQKWKNEDNDYDEWKKLDRYDQMLYRTADIVEFLRREVLSQYNDEKSTDEFKNVWHYILGTIEIRDNDPGKYATSRE